MGEHHLTNHNFESSDPPSSWCCTLISSSQHRRLAHVSYSSSFPRGYLFLELARSTEPRRDPRHSPPIPTVSSQHALARERAAASTLSFSVSVTSSSSPDRPGPASPVCLCPPRARARAIFARYMTQDHLFQPSSASNMSDRRPACRLPRPSTDSSAPTSLSLVVQPALDTGQQRRPVGRRLAVGVSRPARRRSITRRDTRDGRKRPFAAGTAAESMAGLG